MAASRQEKRLRRKVRIRAKISGTPLRPRLSVYRSNKGMYAQLIDDVTQVTVVGINYKMIKTGKTKVEKAFAMGEELGKLALAKNITTCVFDRAGYRYHGRIKAIAEGVRSAGLKV